jgi:hypothetical protein
MINLRQEAKDRDCTVMLPGICNRNPETTVLAHLNNKRLFKCGMGLKVPDWAGAWACSDCHDVIDHRRKADIGNAELLIMFHEGVFRTQKTLADEGKLWVS